MHLAFLSIYVGPNARDIANENQDTEELDHKS